MTKENMIDALVEKHFDSCMNDRDFLLSILYERLESLDFDTIACMYDNESEN
jgi:hypothetical protein